MKKALKKELTTKTKVDLLKQIGEKQSLLTKSRMDLKIGKLKNTSMLRVMADELAVLKTILREKLLLEGEKEK